MLFCDSINSLTANILGGFYSRRNNGERITKKGAKIMKQTKRSCLAKPLMSVITLALAGAIVIGMISDSHAIKLCQLDWFAAWQSKAGQLANWTYAYTRTYGSQSEAGTWTVTSDEGSPGVQHTVSGMSMCGSSTTSGTSQSATLADNKNCWCRMTSPNLGASWVFLYVYSSAAVCAFLCAYDCAGCVQAGGAFSCSRSAVLALP
jgi:hypothetical protein